MPGKQVLTFAFKLRHVITKNVKNINSNFFFFCPLKLYGIFFHTALSDISANAISKTFKYLARYIFKQD